MPETLLKKTDCTQAEPRGFPQAAITLLPWQKYAILITIATLIIGAFLSWRTELLIINAIITIYYLAATCYRILIIDMSLRKVREIQIAPHEMILPPNGKWPKYLIQIPIYKEGGVLPELTKALSALDYPKDRLEIRLLIEEDDDDTMPAALALNLQEPFVIYPIPPSYPRTKPKACNVGLYNTDADFLVIYDAEDRPEPDQLKKAVIAFHKSPDTVACIQAKLNFYNPKQNFLTRCFTAEYATWFDLSLPGLDYLKAPIPLGGTSNHFRLPILQSLKGWDEYNVTEDCDLGLRLFAHGWQTRILDSTTWEQACPNLIYWIKQRSRWVKGYIQTYLIHNREPIKLMKKLGLKNSIHFHLLIGSTPICQLINPLYWLMALLWIVVRPSGFNQFFPTPIFAMGILCLFIGNFTFAYTSAIACTRRGFGSLTKYGLAMPIYWVLLSIGAWRGFLQLITNPHYWDKTKHFSND